jgi:hypothetical protein
MSKYKIHNRNQINERIYRETPNVVFEFNIKFEGVLSGSPEEMKMLQDMLGTAWEVERDAP